MAKSISFNKRELEKKKQSKRLEKQKRKEDRKANAGSGSFEDMIAYVDEYGVITDTPPDAGNKQDIDIENIAVSTPKREEEEVSAMTGSVEYFSQDKGYGFIKASNSKEKFFFHISNAPSSIGEGDMVTYELERGQRGMNAVNIVFANNNPG
jgi:cold shock CspA family protein